MPDIKFAIRISLIFFAIGTSLLMLFYFSLSPTVASIGYAYTGLALLIGIIYLILISFKVNSKKITARQGLKCAGIMLINVPFAAAYFYFVMILMTTARVTFENNTGRDVRSVVVSGCGNRTLGELKAGESKTVWIPISHECSLDVFYEVDREPRHETVIGYLVPNAGVIETYKIGSNENVSR